MYFKSQKGIVSVSCHLKEEQLRKSTLHTPVQQTHSFLGGTLPSVHYQLVGRESQWRGSRGKEEKKQSSHPVDSLLIHPVDLIPC